MECLSTDLDIDTGKKIVDFFVNNKTDAGHYCFILKEEYWDTLCNILPRNFRTCYISDNELIDICKTNEVLPEQFLREDLLPNLGHIMSGDFGELLCFFVTLGFHAANGEKLKGFKKWKWKYERNKASPGTDDILFNSEPTNPQTSDFLISIESKMKATKETACPINSALEGANKDAKTRLITSLEKLRENLSRHGLRNSDEYRLVERFRKPDQYGTYGKYFRAMAFFDSSFFDPAEPKLYMDHNKDHNNITIMAFSIRDLQKLYQAVFEKIPKVEL